MAPQIGSVDSDRKKPQESGNHGVEDCRLSKEALIISDIIYTSELDHSAGGAEPEVLLQDRLKKGKDASTTPSKP